MGVGEAVAGAESVIAGVEAEAEAEGEVGFDMDVRRLLKSIVGSVVRVLKLPSVFIIP